MKVELHKEHEWLKKLLGDWTYESTMLMGPDNPPAVLQGSESVRSLEGLWVISESQGEMPGGGTASNIMTLGYDPEKKRYVGTWLSTMMAYLWIYEGEVDMERNILSLHSKGPSMTKDGELDQYKDVIEFKSDNHRVFTASVLGENGQWQELMTITYRRKQT